MRYRHTSPRAIALVVLTVALSCAPPAVASSPSPSQSAYVTNGEVDALAVDAAGHTYLGGRFDTVGPRLGSGLELTTSDATPASNWPDISGGSVRAVQPDGNGGWFVGGDFKFVGGVARANLAHIESDGSLDASWNPSPDGRVNALAADVSGLYVGGTFNSIGGQSRTYLARVSTTGTGAADATWSADADAYVYALAVSGSDVFVGGDFTHVGTVARDRIAKLSTSAGTVDPDWNPDANSEVDSLLVVGSDVYVGGYFHGPGAIGGQASTRLAKLSATGTGGADANWAPNPDGVPSALAVSGTDLFVGGNFHSIGGQSRSQLAKLATTGSGAADTDWNPNPQQGPGVNGLAIAGGALYVAGGFRSVGGQPVRSLAKVATSGTGTVDATWNPNLSDVAFAVAASGTSVYVGGRFTTGGPAAVTRNNLARLGPDGSVDTAWNPNADNGVRALAVSGGSLYVGGNFSGVDSIGGQDRDYLARIPLADPAGGADATWHPNPNRGVATLVPAGPDLYVGGDFHGANSIGGADRDYLAKVSKSGAGAADPAWNPAPTSDVDALALGAGGLYVAGYFTGTQSIGGQDRDYLAKVATTGSGAADPTWNPAPDNEVDALGVSGGTVYAGGRFGTIGGLTRNYLAKLASGGAGAADPTWDPNPKRAVVALAPAGTAIYAGGGFSTIGGQPVFGVARLSTAGAGDADPTFDPEPLDGVNALAVSGTALATGGAFVAMGPLSLSHLALFPGYGAAPENSLPPAISGVPAETRRLTEADGEWINTPTAFARHWVRCDASGRACVTIAGATGTTYVLRAADAGHTVRVAVTASNAAGTSAAALSPPTAKVAPVPPPVITGAHFTRSTFTRKAGTKLKLTLSKPASITVLVTRKVHGEQVKKGVLSFSGRSGPNSFPFKPKLKPGRYTAWLTARDALGKQSNLVGLKFKVRRSRR